MLEVAPEDLNPFGPMLARTPALAMGDLYMIWESTFCWRVTATREQGVRKLSRCMEGMRI